MNGYTDNDRKQMQGAAMWAIGCVISLFFLIDGQSVEVSFIVGGPIIVAGVIRFCQGIG